MITFDGDIDSFDVSGIFNGGNALYGDVNAYGGNFSLIGTGPRRAYFLVTNSDASGTPVVVGNPRDLGGEAIHKLEYVFNNPAYGGTNNNGYLLSEFGLP